jgi:hypothetical protein
MTALVWFQQRASRLGGKVATVTKQRHRRWGQVVNRAMPVLLDTTGTMLLSGSVMMLNVAAGVAAAGVSLIVLNWRFYGRQ